MGHVMPIMPLITKLFSQIIYFFDSFAIVALLCSMPSFGCHDSDVRIRCNVVFHL